MAQKMHHVISVRLKVGRCVILRLPSLKLVSSKRISLKHVSLKLVSLKLVCLKLVSLRHKESSIVSVRLQKDICEHF